MAGVGRARISEQIVIIRSPFVHPLFTLSAQDGVIVSLSVREANQLRRSVYE